MGEWQPIDSAPQDGTPVIVACPPDLQMQVKPQWIVGEAYWQPEENWPGNGGWWWANTSPGDYHADAIHVRGSAPTQWQPLPAPPTAQRDMQEVGG